LHLSSLQTIRREGGAMALDALSIEKMKLEDLEIALNLAAIEG
jgi:hypothetical protein